ncbi:43576_t:CDS:1 [Gigaspora margarita]|uniref:43576_t:CDS:1 n=1 Tax=Gigaspora margarita TaxID=4874 RepID=A0ABN7UMK4_GIGMA|nr:43576_t:CDS:1 [Gigaspora margarita]
METKEGIRKATNCLDDILQLKKIEAMGLTNYQKESNIQVCRWYGFVLVKAAVKYYAVDQRTIETCIIILININLRTIWTCTNVMYKLLPRLCFQRLKRISSAYDH